MQKKITVIFRGGIGNQLFTYLFAERLKEKLNIKYVKYVFYGDLHHSDKPININDLINIKCKKLKIENKYLKYLYFFFFYKLFNISINDYVNFNKIKKSIFKNYLVDGYFQDQKFYDKKILKKFLGILTNKLKLKKKNIVVISTRRTYYDYLGWALPLKYYVQSIKKLKIRKSDTIYITGDEEAFCILMVSFLKKRGYEKCKYFSSKKNKSYYDFKIIAEAKKLVMSNSTFCWWAASLRSFVGLNTKDVTFPKNWLPKEASKYFGFKGPGNPLKWNLI